MTKRVRAIAAVALLLAGVSAQAVTTTWVAGPAGTAKGLTYTLTGTSVDSDTWSFALGITGINVGGVGGDQEGGRTALSALAFNQPTGYMTAAMTGATLNAGGLNAKGCHGNSASEFCFSGFNAAVSGSSMTLNFIIDASNADTAFAAWVPHIKVDWAGSQNNYDLVSTNMAPVPEPVSALLTLAGLGVVGAVVAGRRRRVPPAVCAAAR